MNEAEQILRALTSAPGPITATELRAELRRLGLVMEEHELIRALRGLRHQGAVQLQDGTRWKAMVAPPSARPPPSLSGNPGGGNPRDLVPPPRRSEPRPVPTVLAGHVAPGSRWALFRRLCRYYVDCLLQDEAPQLRSYVDNEDDTWVILREAPWCRLAQGGGFAVPLSKDQAGFQRNRARQGADDCVYIGYPSVLVRPGATSAFLVPVFAQPVRARWENGALHLSPDGPIAVNGAWVEYRFRRRTERDEFLRAMGLLSTAEEDDPDADERSGGVPDFASLAQSAAHYTHDPTRFAEAIQPFALDGTSGWSKRTPGLYNCAMLTTGPRLKYTRSLVRDLRAIAGRLSDEDLDGTALAHLFPHEPPDNTAGKGADAASGRPATGRACVERPPADRGEDGKRRPEQDGPDGLTPQQLAQVRLIVGAQRQAVANSLYAPASLVTGPPGTGKSEVVVATLVNQLLRGRATLFASKNHQALEAVVPRLNALCDAGQLVVQTSSRDLAQRQDYLTKLQGLLASPPRSAPPVGVDPHAELCNALTREGAALEVQRVLVKARKEYEVLSGALYETRSRLPRHLQSDNESTRWPEQITPARVSELETGLRSLLGGHPNLMERLWRCCFRRAYEARIRRAAEPLMALPDPGGGVPRPTPLAGFEEWAPLFALWKPWAEAAVAHRALASCEERIAAMPSTETSERELRESQRLLEESTLRWLSWAGMSVTGQMSPEVREALANLRAGIQVWGVDRFAKEVREHFPLLLRAFPLWSVSNLSARTSLPLVPGRFDLLVVDEASQCDIPSVVPLLARSRRAVLVGDPMQLQHVTQLDPAIESSLLHQHQLTDVHVQRFTYRVNSAFDLADASGRLPNELRTRLDMHFRSHGHIAGYCNQAFYADTLHVVTATDRLRVPRGRRPGVHWADVAGAVEQGQTGAWCQAEIDVVMQELQGLGALDYDGTVGVVTPFRQQMIRIRDAFEAASEHASVRRLAERSKLLISTAHGFQGDERDVILFSLCAGPGMPDGATAFLKENRNLFNVAVSRARAVLHVVGNLEWALHCGVPFIEALARHSQSGQDAERRNPELYQSPWEKILAGALREAGVEAVPQYPIAGRFLDLAVLSPTRVDIEVDGESVHRTAGGNRKDDDYWRDLQLTGLGWRVCRFWVYELREDLAGCVGKVLRILDVPR